MLDNKKGQMTIWMFLLIIGVFIFAILIFIGGLTIIKIDESLDQDIQIGQVNLQDVNDDTFGIYSDTFVNSADWWGISVIFGMVLGLFLSSFILRGRLPKWAVVLDIFIILAAFLVSLYISSAYSTLLEALAAAGEPFLETVTPKTSMFIVNLPVFTVIIGVVMMMLFHASFPKREDDLVQMKGGFLQSA